MLIIGIDERCMRRVEELELEIKDWKKKILESGPIMKEYFTTMISYNEEIIDRYLTNGITIEKEA